MEGACGSGALIPGFDSGVKAEAEEPGEGHLRGNEEAFTGRQETKVGLKEGINASASSVQEQKLFPHVAIFSFFHSE